jgi:hypothetical protein
MGGHTRGQARNDQWFDEAGDEDLGGGRLLLSSTSAGLGECDFVESLETRIAPLVLAAARGEGVGQFVVCRRPRVLE